MSRRGWVSAEDAAGDWWRLSVFDDGWVELPGFARAVSDTRAHLRELGLWIGALVLLGVLSFVVAGSPLAETGVPMLVSLAFVAVLVTAVVRTWVFRVRDLRQSAGDAAQVRRDRGTRPPVRRRPGAPLFRRARSSAEFAGWLDGVRRVALSEVAAVRVSGSGSRADPVVVTVALTGGQTLAYRSPDRTLARLFAPWAGAVR